MDVKTHALDRVLEALAPSLGAELERVVQETRQALEQEFQTRLQTAVREAQAAAQAEQSRAVERAKDDTRRQVTAELEQQFGERLQAMTSQLGNEAAQERARLEAATASVRNEAAQERGKLEAEMAQLKNEWSSELNKVEDERERWRTFAESQRELAEASSQPEMLVRFLNVAQPFADGLAVYVAKADGLALWKSKGNGAFPKIISRETIDPESYFKTISVRGRTVAAVCASPSFQRDALDFLTGSLERAVEAFALKLRAAPK